MTNNVTVAKDRSRCVWVCTMIKDTQKKIIRDLYEGEKYISEKKIRKKYKKKKKKKKTI